MKVAFLARGWLFVIALLFYVPLWSGQAAEESAKTKVRLLTLKGWYADHPNEDEFSTLGLLFGGMERPKSFPDLCHQLETWLEDEEVNHLLLDFSKGELRLNPAQAEELIRHVRSLQKAGKRTFALLGDASPIPFSVAAACDQVLMTDLSVLDFPSLSLSVLHFHDLFRLLGVEASVVRAGDFKGAVEPFTREEMSPELRAHYRAMLSKMNDSLVKQIAEGRKVSVEKVREAQGIRLFSAQQAKANGLIDEIIAPGEEREVVEKLLAQSIKWIEPASPKQVKPLSFFDLVGKLLAPPTRPAARKPSVAVLHLDGTIMDGGLGLDGILTPATINEAVTQLIADEAIRGVVVRINSPGGSVTASEAIRRSLERLAKAKPINISFGELAASGGYWVSCLGRPVYAEASTITGSIGVFALKLSGGQLLSKAGLHLDTVSLDESANAFSFDRPWNPQEQAQLQKYVDEVYTRFVELVARSRGLAADQVQPMAGGRVWSGAQALDLKLVDHLGGMDAALADIAKEANLEPGYPILHWPQEKTLMEKLELFGAAQEQMTPAPWVRLLPTELRRRMPWHLLQAGLSGKGSHAWALLPNQLEVQ